jgi:hypothetical protein
LIRVPLIFSLPGVIPDRVTIGDQVRLLDVLPTVLDLMGIRQESHLEGVSLEPLIAGDGSPDDSKTALLSGKFAYSESILYGTEKKSVTAYPWKLIYDAATGDRMLYNLADDPAEQCDVDESLPEARMVLNEVLIKTLCGISETWYVELAGDDNRLDVALTLPSRPIPGEFEICEFFDEQGNLVGQKGLTLDHVKTRAEHTLTLRGLELDGRLTLALKIAPRSSLLSFDLKIDDESAIDRTYLGKDLTAPRHMPFTQNDAYRELSRGEPGNRPRAPYVVIWHSGNDPDVDTPVNLAEDTRRRLKALGYIQ